jgi:hypothetical protein
MPGLLTNKLGPLPTWGWLGIGFVAYYLYEKNKAGSSAPASGTPDYVFQNYNQLPPAAPTPPAPTSPGGHHRHKHPHGKPKKRKNEESGESAAVQKRERHTGEQGTTAYRRGRGRGAK